MKRCFLIVTLVLFLFVSVGFSQTVYLTETFSDGVAENEWLSGYPGYSPIIETAYMENNPSGDNWVGMLNMNDAGVSESYTGDENWTDYYYEANIYVPINEGWYYGIEFRVRVDGEATTAYQFSSQFNVSSMEQRLRFRIRPSMGFPEVIQDWYAADIPGGVPTLSGWNKFAVQAVGNQFWLYFNDQEMPGCPYENDMLTQGGVGVYLFDMMADIGITLYADDLVVREPSNAIEEENEIEGQVGFKLHQNFPNPVTNSTAIRFHLPRTEKVSLEIFNLLGQRIRTLCNRSLDAGMHEIEWDGRTENSQRATPGIYYYRLHALDFDSTQKLIVVE